jgi:hypothetical protein
MAQDSSDDNRASEAQKWIETIMGIKFNDFFEEIKDGVILCELCNTIKPGSCPQGKYKKSSVAFVCRTNIQIYLEGCGKIGVPKIDCFETRDLYDGQRLDAVVNNIFALSAASRNIDSFEGPYIGVTYAQKNQRNFTQEQLNKTKSAVPIWNKGDVEQKQKNMDSYGIIKVEKDAQKHSGVQGVWDQGSLQSDTSSKHDSYGIIKNADLTKHTGVQSKWEQGSLQNDTSSKHDSYGIVKNADLTKHSGVQSKWEQGSLQNDTSSKHDSYGIIKNADQTKHSGVQSKWEQGSLETNTSTQHDSYGVIKVPSHLQKKEDKD